MSEGGTKKAKLERLTKEVDEETIKWKELGINMNMMKFTPEEMFMLQCMHQALVNCYIQGKNEEVDLNIELKEVTLTTMRKIREDVEPMVLEARKAQMGVPQPNIILPWDRSRGNQN